MSREYLKEKKRIVIKVGSSSLTHQETGRIDFRRMEMLVRQISDVVNSNKEVVLVTSGAVAVGQSILKIDCKKSGLAHKQAAASVGQASLMMKYNKVFREYDHEVGQVLITKDLIQHEERKENAVRTFKALLELGVIPIVNENDTVATEEIEFGDNDTLSAIVASLVDADLLILLSDIDGLFNMDPTQNKDAVLLKEIRGVTPEIEEMAVGSSSAVGTGGMKTKLQAAQIANRDNIDMVIANASTNYVIDKILSGEDVGTLFRG